MIPSSIEAGHDYLSELNDQQRQAVEYLDGPELVIAGAGSGKTRVLTYKIVHLLCNGYEPWRILALTFTNKAAREMRERIQSLVGPATASKLWMGTFHSIFARILRTNAARIGFKSSFTIYDTSDSKSLIKMIIKDFDLDEKVYKVSTVMSAISWAKNSLISPDRYAATHELVESDSRSRRPLIYEIYRSYQARLFTAGAMDFDDLLYYTHKLFSDNPDLLRHYREFFKYVLVDEYQDTNFAQHAIVQMLTENGGNVCVVGDDAQSIYSFRGASIGNILNLEHSYPDLQTFKLERNYRSTKSIINTANSLIEKNSKQIFKQVFSLNEDGRPVEVMKSYSDMEEAMLVASRISALKMAGNESLEEFAILYRTNAQSRQLEEALRKRNIDYRIWGGLSFYQRKEVKDAVAYFRLAVNPDDDEALRRVINCPMRGIGDTSMKKIQRVAMESGKSIWHIITHSDEHSSLLRKSSWHRIEGFRNLIISFNDMVTAGDKNAYEIGKEIIWRCGLMKELLHEHTPETVSRRENLQELLNGAREFVEMKLESGEEDVSLPVFLTTASLATDQDRNNGDAQREAVTLMTVHASKGLEFGNVFIVGVEDELFPSAMSMDSAESIEEERRLLYVAITRAKRFCMMTYASSRFRNGQTVLTNPSPFLRDIDPHYLNITDSANMATGTRNPMERYRTSYHSTACDPVHRQGAATVAARTSARAVDAMAADQGIVRHTPTDVQPGDKIYHPNFGCGVVQKVDTGNSAPRMIVLFDNTLRTLVFKYAKFKIL